MAASLGDHDHVVFFLDADPIFAYSIKKQRTFNDRLTGLF
jgi:hypothetical protein